MNRTLRIVSIDDDPEDGLLLERVLAQTNHWKVRHERYEDATRGVVAALKQRADVVFLDVLMQPRTGLEVLQRLVAEGFRGPVIMLTGYARPDLAVACMKTGASDWLAKDSLDVASVERVLANALEGRALRREVDRRGVHLRRANRELARRNQNLRRLSRVISQEISTPLAVATEFCRLLSAATSEDHRDTYASLVVDACRQAEGHVEDLLDLVSLAEGKLRLDPVAEPTGALLRRCARMMMPLAANRGVDLRLFVEPDLGDVNVDPRRMLQVLLDVIRNLLMTCPAGSTLDVRGARSGRETILMIEAPAAGPDAAELARLLLDDEPGDGFEMVAVSLHHARDVVALHGGELTTGALGEDGARWCIRLPALTEEPQDPALSIDWEWQGNEEATAPSEGRTG